MTEHVCTCDNKKLVDTCKAFIKAQEIRCPEDIYQSDRVIENAYEFIESICNILGYLPSEDD